MCIRDRDSPGLAVLVEQVRAVERVEGQLVIVAAFGYLFFKPDRVRDWLLGRGFRSGGQWQGQGRRRSQSAQQPQEGCDELVHTTSIDRGVGGHKGGQ